MSFIGFKSVSFRIAPQKSKGASLHGRGAPFAQTALLRGEADGSRPRSSIEACDLFSGCASRRMKMFAYLLRPVMKRIIIVAASARVAVLSGESVLSDVPLITPLPRAHCIALIAQTLTLATSSYSARFV